MDKTDLSFPTQRRPGFLPLFGAVSDQECQANQCRTPESLDVAISQFTDSAKPARKVIQLAACDLPSAHFQTGVFLDTREQLIKPVS